MATTTAQAAADDEVDESTVHQDSSEQGQTSLTESFEPSRAERIREQRRQAFADTTYDIHLRSFYLDRDKFDDSVSEAWAGGGWAGLKTGWFRDRFAFGITGYGSFPISADDDEDRTQLDHALPPGPYAQSGSRAKAEPARGYLGAGGAVHIRSSKLSAAGASRSPLPRATEVALQR